MLWSSTFAWFGGGGGSRIAGGGGGVVVFQVENESSNHQNSHVTISHCRNGIGSSWTMILVLVDSNGDLLVQDDQQSGTGTGSVGNTQHFYSLVLMPIRSMYRR